MNGTTPSFREALAAAKAKKLAAAANAAQLNFRELERLEAPLASLPPPRRRAPMLPTQLARGNIPGRSGPCLPPFAYRANSIYVQEEDVGEFLPDGWGKQTAPSMRHLARAAGLPPLALPLLALLEWTSRFAPQRKHDILNCGSGFQVSLNWLARKMGCSRVWVQALLNRLDPLAKWRRLCFRVSVENRRRVRRRRPLLRQPRKPPGVAFIQRFRRFKRFDSVHNTGGPKMQSWVDADGRQHLYFDTRGVCYLTSAGRKLLLLPKGQAKDSELSRRGRFVSWKLSARLRRGRASSNPTDVKEALQEILQLFSTAGPIRDLSPNHYKQTN